MPGLLDTLKYWLNPNAAEEQRIREELVRERYKVPDNRKVLTDMYKAYTEMPNNKLWLQGVQAYMADNPDFWNSLEDADKEQLMGIIETARDVAPPTYQSGTPWEYPYNIPVDQIPDWLPNELPTPNIFQSVPYFDPDKLDRVMKGIGIPVTPSVQDKISPLEKLFAITGKTMS